MINLLKFLLVGFLLGYLFALFYEKCFLLIEKKKNKKPYVIIKGYHFHHSIYGLIAILFSIIFASGLLFGFGLGIIIRHTYDFEGKFTFIEKYPSS